MTLMMMKRKECISFAQDKKLWNTCSLSESVRMIEKVSDANKQATPQPHRGTNGDNGRLSESVNKVVCVCENEYVCMLCV